MVYSGFIPLRYYGRALKAVGVKEEQAAGQLSSFQALTSAIAATVGLGNISGVAVAITLEAGSYFLDVGQCRCRDGHQVFEGTLAVMYKGKDSGEVQGGTMYMITEDWAKMETPGRSVFFCLGL